jgi:hypothetical protein
MSDDVIRSGHPDDLRTSPPPAPVRQAFWLATAGLALVAAKTVAAGTLVAGWGAAYEAAGPGSIDEDVLARMHTFLVAGAVVGGVVTILLGVATLAVGRRADTSRTLVGFLALLSAIALLLGVVFSPESAISAEDAADLARHEVLVPAWFQALSSVTVAGVVLLFGIAFARMGRAAAVDYYQEHDPDAGWGGFTSWLDIMRRP